MQEALDKNTANDDVELPATIAQIDHHGFRDGDILQMDRQVEVDDDNLPASGNVPIVDDGSVKEPDYTMTLMHFSDRDAVDSHNSSRMSPIAMEEIWKITRCPLWVSRIYY